MASPTLIVTQSETGDGSCRIWKRLEGRGLPAARERFTGETLEGAHSAEADSIACMKVLAGILSEFGDNRVPDTTPAGLADFVRDAD